MEWTREQQEIQERMEELLFKPWNGDRQTVPLFHYTSARGFAGIIESGEVWATRFDHMNDRRELTIGEEIVRREAQKMLARFRPESPQAWILGEFVRIEPLARLTKHTSVYLASLSERGDLLSQWRAYAADGSGYSIGFSQLPLPTEDRPTAQAGLYLVRCEYDEEPFADRIRVILREVATGFEQFVQKHNGKKELFDAVHHSALAIAYRRVAAEIPCLKHKAFSEEKEWRLVVLPLDIEREGQIAKFRTDSGELTPYVELGLSGETPQAQPDVLQSREEVPAQRGCQATAPKARMALSSVVVGPSLDPTRSEATARLLLVKHGYDPSLVRVSEAPYRGSGP
jgi:hypothetical protein